MHIHIHIHIPQAIPVMVKFNINDEAGVPTPQAPPPSVPPHFSTLCHLPHKNSFRPAVACKIVVYLHW